MNVPYARSHDLGERSHFQDVPMILGNTKGTPTTYNALTCVDTVPQDHGNAWEQGMPDGAFPSPPSIGGERPGTPPTWLVEKITAARRAAQQKHCPRCGASILIGPDGDIAALTVAVNVEPIDVYTEVQAATAGIDTYNAWPAPGGQTVELHYRTSFHRHGIRQVPVLAEHTCEDP